MGTFTQGQRQFLLCLNIGVAIVPRKLYFVLKDLKEKEKDPPERPATVSGNFPNPANL